MTSHQISKSSDDQLWVIINSIFSQTQDLRLNELNMIGKNGGLSTAEQAELETLIEAHDQFILLRSQALLTLKQRGHSIEQCLKQTK